MFGIAVASSFVLSNMFSLKTLYIANWQVGAHPKELHMHVADTEYGSEQVVEWTAATLTDAYNKNAVILNEKATDLRRVIFWFWFAIVFVVALGVVAII